MHLYVMFYFTQYKTASLKPGEVQAGLHSTFTAASWVAPSQHTVLFMFCLWAEPWCDGACPSTEPHWHHSQQSISSVCGHAEGRKQAMVTFKRLAALSIQRRRRSSVTSETLLSAAWSCFHVPVSLVLQETASLFPHQLVTAVLVMYSICTSEILLLFVDCTLKIHLIFLLVLIFLWYTAF